MKKKQQKGAVSVASDIVATPAVDLKTLIHDHTQFFDKLIELIPAKFYLPVDEDSKPWVQGLSKVKRASLKQQTRENIKKSRRDRLDPEKAQTTTLDLLKKNISKNEKADKDSDDEEDDDDDEEEEIEIKVKPMTEFDGESNEKSVTYEELQQRLHHKLEMLRANRGQGKRTMLMNERRESGDFTDKKRKREDRDKHYGGKDAASGSGSGSGSDKGKEKIEADFEFGKVKLGDEDGSKKKAKKVSKVKELEKAQKLKEAKKENVVVATKHSWKAATEKAMGVKVHDNPKLLKKSLHKEKKRREKSAGKWKERVETQDKLREEKQAKRRGNIEERASQKKMRKIAKREKKLMRPGFEGRKEGYIGDK